MKNNNVLVLIWKVIYPALMYLLISNIIAYIFLMAYMVYEIRPMMASGAQWDVDSLTMQLQDATVKYSLLLTGISALVTIPVVSLLYRKDIKKFGIPHEGSSDIINFIIIIPLAIFSCIGFNNVISASNLIQLFPGYSDVAEQIYGSNIYIEVIVTVILAPIIEELVFRGFAYRRISRYWGRRAGLIVSALLFGIYHFNVVQGVYAFLIGLVFAFVYERFQTLVAPIVAHSAANLLSVLMVETTWFDGWYKSNIMFFVITISSLVLTGGFVYLLFKKTVNAENVIS